MAAIQYIYRSIRWTYSIASYALVTVIVLLITVFHPPVSAQGAAADRAIIMDSSFKYESIWENAWYLEDPGGGLGIDDVMAGENRARFKAASGVIPNMGFSSSACWVRFTVENRLDQEAEFFLRINYFQISSLVLYIPEKGSYRPLRSGTDIPHDRWSYDNEKHAFSVTQPKGVATYYLRAESRYGSLFLPAALMSGETFHEKISMERSANSFFYGILAALLLFNLFILLSARQKVYLYYVLYILTVSATMMAFDGTGFRLIWSGVPAMNRSYFMILLVCSTVTLFSKKFLEVDRRLPLLGKFMSAAIIAAIASSLLYFIIPERMPHVSVIMTVFTCMLSLAAGIAMLGLGERAARYYVISWSFIFTGAVARGVLGITGGPLFQYHEYIIKAALGLQVLTFSLALADRINLMRKELARKMKEQKELDEKLNIKNQELGATNEELQAAMEELEATNEELQATMEEFEAQNEMLIKSQSEIEQSERLFREIFENTPFAITITSLRDGTFVMINRAFEKITGYEKNEALGKTANEISLNIEPEFAEKHTGDLQSHGKVENMIARAKNRAGEELYCIFSSIPIDYHGEACALTMTVDITKTRKLEEQLRQSQKMDIIGKLAGGIAHDFNNMLAGILGSAEMLDEKLAGDPETKEYIEIIKNAASRAGDMTRKLLVFSRKEPAIKKKIDAHGPVRSAISLLERSIDRKIKIITGLDAADSEIQGDASLLQNVFMNLGINARDAMPDGGILTFSSSNVNLEKEYCEALPFQCEPGSYIEISVIDNGTGMPREVMERMYEPFFTTKETGKGTGLGLSIVYGTVKEHGGTISVRSDPGKGTEIKIYLPLRTSREIVADNISEIPVSGNGLVLVVDDEDMVRKLLGDMLTSLGYEVITANDGLQGLDTFIREKDRISLIILDMIMPRMNGMEMFQRLREIDPSVKVLFSSGFNRDEGIYGKSNVAPDGFLQKPYGINELSKIVADIIGKNK